jgi:hypothetical protein
MKTSISIVSLALCAALCLGFAHVNASEVTGTLSSNGVTSITTGGSSTGSVSGTVTDGSSGGGGGGGGGSSSGSRRGSSRNNDSDGEVLGASTDDLGTSYPGLPNAGRAR